MKQSPPTSWGTIKWRGGPGHKGQKGGWGFECAWCTTGDKRSADTRKWLAEQALVAHCVDKHSYRPEVKVVLLAAKTKPSN